MPPAGFETAIPAIERPQTHALDRAANGTGSKILRPAKNRTVYNKLYVPVTVHRE